MLHKICVYLLFSLISIQSRIFRKTSLVVSLYIYIYFIFIGIMGSQRMPVIKRQFIQAVVILLCISSSVLTLDITIHVRYLNLSTIFRKTPSLVCVYTDIWSYLCHFLCCLDLLVEQILQKESCHQYTAMSVIASCDMLYDSSLQS